MLYEHVPKNRKHRYVVEYMGTNGGPVTGLQSRFFGLYHRFLSELRMRRSPPRMQTHLQPASAEEERAELEVVVESLGRSSRLANLLQYIGQRYFAGQGDELSEYVIATEVFGRSRSTFDASEDAIARVEAHRLRKRLKEYYEGAGRDHTIQISVPPGTYVPSFTRRTVETASSPAAKSSSGSTGTTKQSPTEPPAPQPALPGSQRRGRILAIAPVVVILAAIAGFWLYRSHTSPAAPESSPAASPQQQPAPAVPPGAAVRILAGYTGAPQTDSAGAEWGADRFVHGGGAWRRSDAPIARTSDPFLFENWRNGDSFYDIPLRPGVYELHLYFVTAENSADSMPSFNVKINGNPALAGFDINTDALGANIADERVFRDVSPAADGKLHLAFTSERGAPQVNAIEVVPGLPHKTLPIRLVMQHTSYTDHEGRFWHGDDYFMDGFLSGQRQEISGSPDPDLFSTERFGHFTYAIPVDSRDRYTLILHFVEFYFGPNAPGGGGAGSRVFKVMCNGQTLLDNFDIYKEAGSLHVLTRTFSHLKPSAQGKLNLTFEPIANNATVSGIEVLDESQ